MYLRGRILCRADVGVEVNRGCFITGTDTGVGKTVVSAAVLLQRIEREQRVMYMKPVQTGCRQAGGERIAPDPDYGLRLAGITPAPEDRADICPYRLLMPASPHLAAAREDVTISIDRILESYERLQRRHAFLVVEGAGGVLVPLNDSDTMLELMRRLALPVIIACRAGLGTLNHTLLTVRVLRDAGLDLAGLVLVQTTPEPWGDIEEDNRCTLERMAAVPVTSRIAYHPALAAGTADPRILRSCVQGTVLPDSIFPVK